MMSRSAPPIPLWRFRSKQVLGVIDEKLLSFTCEEAEKLFKLYGLSKTKARKAQKDSFGRILRLKF